MTRFAAAGPQAAMLSWRCWCAAVDISDEEWTQLYNGFEAKLANAVRQALATSTD